MHLADEAKTFFLLKDLNKSLTSKLCKRRRQRRLVRKHRRRFKLLNSRPSRYKRRPKLKRHRRHLKRRQRLMSGRRRRRKLKLTQRRRPKRKHGRPPGLPCRSLAT